jgi:dimethylaniline monooxygenase (N-oxide forming)
MAEQQIQLYLLLTSHRVPIPRTAEHYHLLHKPEGRIQYGVDYSSYMSQLARDMGSAPGLGQLWREHGLFVLLIYW